MVPISAFSKSKFKHSKNTWSMLHQWILLNFNVMQKPNLKLKESGLRGDQISNLWIESMNKNKTYFDYNVHSYFAHFVHNVRQIRHRNNSSLHLWKLFLVILSNSLENIAVIRHFTTFISTLSVLISYPQFITFLPSRFSHRMVN